MKATNAVDREVWIVRCATELGNLKGDLNYKAYMGAARAASEMLGHLDPFVAAKKIVVRDFEA